ncbi:MAG: SUF system NifU family Fe-S cluster assembly protein [Candidatus Muproteobacteria bacterium RBG_16_64_11]|uniref:SUF system NifU family Fe-S cluster assembly protein n=1 Tax=Candidatus Muproteobacteria bacterium RBG_16_64_11 TaxID=1817758 RepID=A0A1F6TAY8_9PROT|nr:MAG: SUF system NifU family Fe-S cluster assembly protein [Candidatus Muproteobacteria bacterium RBG_16_64_11]
MATARALYQELILDHNRKPRNFGVLADANRKAEGHNPVCGDHISLSLHIDNGRIENIAFQGQSCAICKASASLMTGNVKGKTVDEAETLIREFRDMATGKLDTRIQQHHLGRLSVFAGVSELPSRVKCAILPWHTLHAAFESVESATTEK